MKTESKNQLTYTPVYQTDDEKSFMPFLSQLYGAGKTTLVRYFRSVVKKCNFQGCNRKENLDNALLIEVDFSKYMDNEKSIADYLNDAKVDIYETVLSQLTENESIDCLNNLYRSFNSFNGFISNYDKKNMLPPLLILFDEIQILHGTQNIQDAATRILKFWSSVIKIKSTKVFFVIAGKSEPLVL